MSLTYDGALRSHRALADELSAAGLRATFYADAARLVQHASEWRRIQRDGHEIGNGCLLAAALPDGSLPAWTSEMIEEDLRAMERLIRELFPAQHEHSFAYPFGLPRCADGEDYRHVVRSHIAVARSGQVGFNSLDDLQPCYLNCVRASHMDGRELIRAAMTAAEDGTWAVLAFDGVDEGRPCVSSDAHDELIEWLIRHEGRLQVAPVADVVKQYTAAGSAAFRLA